ncbi:MAG: hypothetical protein H6653_20295 [Ardenticatenaceae bacterium]|nr:hypothetical protein [Ardenticatenaceae bacterium]
MDTLTCQAISKELLQPHEMSALTERIVEHLATCGACQTRFGYLLRAWQLSNDDSLTCGECEMQLPQYIQVAGTELGTTTRWQPVRHHLATCPHCATAYTELADLLTLVAETDVATLPTAYPTPDLSFLQPKRPWQFNKLGQLVIQLTREWLQDWQAANPRPALAGTHLKRGREPQPLGELTITEAAPDLQVQLVLEQVPEVNHGTLIVTATLPSRGGWPHQAGTEIEVAIGQHFWQRQETDAFGKAVFAKIPLAQIHELAITITPPR